MRAVPSYRMLTKWASSLTSLLVSVSGVSGLFSADPESERRWREEDVDRVEGGTAAPD